VALCLATDHHECTFAYALGGLIMELKIWALVELMLLRFLRLALPARQLELAQVPPWLVGQGGFA
jgi:hypothetical protein